MLFVPVLFDCFTEGKYTRPWGSKEVVSKGAESRQCGGCAVCTGMHATWSGCTGEVAPAAGC